VAAPVRKYREATEAAQTGWSLTRQVSACIPATWLVSDHPLLGEEGNIAYPNQFIHGFIDRAYSVFVLDHPLRAAASRAAVQAFVTGSVSHHEGAAFEANGGITVFNVNERTFLRRAARTADRRGYSRSCVHRQGCERRLVYLDAEGPRLVGRQEL